MVGLEVMAEGVRAGTHSEGWKERIVGAAMLKEQAPNGVWTDGMDSKLVFDSLRE